MRFDKQDWVLLPPIGVLAKIYDALQDHLRQSGPRKADGEGVPLVKVRVICVIRRLLY